MPSNGDKSRDVPAVTMLQFCIVHKAELHVAVLGGPEITSTIEYLKTVVLLLLMMK
jgi:hypothetical protein